MLSFKYIWRIFFLVAFSFATIANGSNYRFEHLTADVGLSQGNVISIFKDSKGFMWFGTEDGLNKFDGYDFTVYRHDPNDPFSISNNLIYSIQEDSRRRLWVMTREGCSIYDPLTDCFEALKFRGQDSIYNDCKIEWFLISDSTSIWIAMDCSLVKYNFINQRIEDKLIDYKGRDRLEHIFVNTLAYDVNGNLWVGSVNGCFVVDFEKKEVIEIVLDVHWTYRIISIYQDAHGKYWLGSYKNGIFVLNKDYRVLKHITKENSNLSHNEINFIRKDFDDNIWVGSNSGLNILSAKKNRDNVYDFIRLYHKQYDPSSLLSDIVNSFYMGDDNIVWIGSRFGGVDFFDPYNKNFNYLSLREGDPFSLSHNNATNIDENKNGEVFIGTDGGGIDVFSNDHRTITPFDQYVDFGTLTNKKVLALAFDKKGKLYVGMWGGGIDIFDFDNRVKIHLKEGDGLMDLESDDIFSLLADSKDNIWIGTARKGFHRVNSGLDQVIKYRLNETDPTIPRVWGIPSMYEDSKGDIWIATAYEGIIRYDYETDEFSRIRKESERNNSLHSNLILCFCESSSGNMWIGTQEGLNIYNERKDRFTLFSTENGLPNNNIFGILHDKDNVYWVSTNNGLSQITVSDETDSINLSFRNFSIEDGLQANQYNRWSYFKSSSGELFFGGVKGVNYFYPKHIVFNDRKPKIVFTSFSIYNKEVAPGAKNSPLKKSISESDEIVLDHKQSLFSIGFAALNFTHADKNNYMCMLEGFEKDWRDLGTERKVTYTNLDAGTYIFKVKACNNDGVWNEEGSSLRIIIEPPFWQTIWFKAIIVFLIALLAYLFIYMRTRNIRNQNLILEQKVAARTDEIREINSDLENLNKIKDKFFSIIAHDLKGPFQSVIGFTDFLKVNYDSVPEKEKKQYIEQIYQSSSKIYELLDNLLSWSTSQSGRMSYNPENLDISLLVVQNLSLLKDTYKQKSIHVGLELLKDVFVFGDMNMINAILRNLLTNAIKFTPKEGHINVLLVNEKTHVKVCVSDDGVGMTSEEAGSIFEIGGANVKKGTGGEKGTGLGLILCKEFVEKNKGRIWVDSNSGIGTTFCFTLPKA